MTLLPIPKGWSLDELSTVADIVRVTIDPADILSGTNYVGLEHIDGSGCFVDISTVEAGDLASNKFAFTAEHILYGKLRPYLKKIARPTFSGVCSTDILPLKAKAVINRDYFYHFLRHPSLIDLATARCSGANLPRLSPKSLGEFPVLLPPLPEQQRIAAILDKADAIRRKRQAALQLTEELLRSAFLEMFGDPVTNPKGWPQKPLGELATFVGGGTPSRAVPEYFEGKICWATSKDMKGEMLLDTQEHITEAGIKNSATKLVEPGALLIVVKSKILMHRLPILINKVPTCFGQDLKAIIPNKTIPALFLARHLRIGQNALLQQARGVNTEGLTLQHLQNYQVLQPPPAMMEQYSSLEQQVMIIREKAQQAKQQSNALFHSLVQRAFRGEL